MNDLQWSESNTRNCLELIICLTVATLGVCLLLVPELTLRRRQPWDSLCRRVTLSWLVLFFAKFSVDQSNRKYLHDLLVLGFALFDNPNSIARESTVVAQSDLVKVTMTSPYGLIGACTAASCSSTGLWLITHLFIYGGTLPSTVAIFGDVSPISHRRREAVHLLVVSLVCVAHGVQLVYYVAFIVVKVISFHAAMRMFNEAERAMISSTHRCRSWVIFAIVIGLKFGLEALSDEQYKNNGRMAAWLAFPESLVGGLVVGTLMEQVIRLNVTSDGVPGVSED